MKFYILPIFLILCLSFTSAYEMSRTIPSQVNPGQAFTVTYAIVNPLEDMYVSWSDKVSGGCSPISANGIMQSNILTSMEKTYIAPNNNTKCKFEGYFQFQDGVTRNLPTYSLQVGTPPEPPAPNITSNETVYVFSTPQNTTAVSSTPKFNIGTITSKFAFFHFLGNDALEGGILLLILLVFIYKIMR